VSYRTLNAAEVVNTIVGLEQRIAGRLPAGRYRGGQRYRGIDREFQPQGLAENLDLGIL
jgi:hypothetical protein